MWLKVLEALILALLKWMESKYEKSKTAKDADRCNESMRRIGNRIRMWENGTNTR